MLRVMVSLVILSSVLTVDLVRANSDDSHIIRIELDIVTLLNPAGFSFTAKGFNQQIYNKSKSPLWDGLYYQVATQLRITPAYSRAGVQFEWMPITILQLRAEYDRLYFSGRFGSLLSFSSNDELFGDDELTDREGDEISAYGTRSALQVTLRAKFDDIILRNVTDFMQYRFPGNGPYYLEREYEILMATSDTVLSNQLYLLFEDKSKKGSRFFGPYHDYVHADKSGLTRERLGVTWLQQYNKALVNIENPRLYVQSGIYLQDPNREEQFYIIVGIGGDIEF